MIWKIIIGAVVVSLPSRERGLKFTNLAKPTDAVAVAPLAGAWIEIDCLEHVSAVSFVAPIAGAWI